MDNNNSVNRSSTLKCKGGGSEAGLHLVMPRTIDELKSMDKEQRQMMQHDNQLELLRLEIIKIRMDTLRRAAKVGIPMELDIPGLGKISNKDYLQPNPSVVIIKNMHGQVIIKNAAAAVISGELDLDLLKIVLTRTDLIKLEAKCTNFDHYAAILQGCLVCVQIEGVNMVAPISRVTNKMCFRNVQFGKRVWLWDLDCFAFDSDQILDTLPFADELVAFKYQSQIPVPTKAEIAKKGQQLVQLLGKDWREGPFIDEFYSLPVTNNKAPIQKTSGEGCSSLDVSMKNITIKQEYPAEIPQEVKQEIFDERPSEFDEIIALQEQQQVSTSTASKETDKAAPAKAIRKSKRVPKPKKEQQEVEAVRQQKRKRQSALTDPVQQQPSSSKRVAKQKKQ